MPENGCRDRYGPCSLSRRRSGTDGPLGWRGSSPFSTLVQILPHVRDGRLKALAVTGERRSPLAADVPTMVESGFDQLITTSVNVIVAPPGTPLAIRRQINHAAAAALASTEVQQAFARLGYEASDLD
ncbi:MAG: hypothetical protein E6G75_09540 [Alphaproteobacteria bacterium]|nr:MAG: hypothetical protein E6G75_09540 [Alphaproteobacteria bacterium]